MLTREDLLAIAELFKPLEERLEANERATKDLAELVKPLEGRLEANERATKDLAELVKPLEGRLGANERATKDLAELVKPLEERLGANERATKELGILVENETNRAINLLFEGHESLKQMIEGRLVTKEQQEESETRIFALEEVSRQHTAQIEELQKKTG